MNDFVNVCTKLDYLILESSATQLISFDLRLLAQKNKKLQKEQFYQKECHCLHLHHILNLYVHVHLHHHLYLHLHLYIHLHNYIQFSHPICRRKGAGADLIYAEAFYCVQEIWLAAGVANLNYRRSKLDFSEAPQPRKGEEPLSNFFLGFKGSAKLKMLGW